MSDPCAANSLKRARNKIEEAALIEFAPKITELRELLESLNIVLEKNGLKLDSGFKTFSNENNEHFDLQSLRSKVHMKRYTKMTDHDRRFISDYANAIQNAQNLLDNKISKSAFDYVMAYIERSCQQRKDWIKKYGDISEKIVGRHQSKYSPNFYYVFSNKPEDMFQKSTGRTWSPHNCERYGGESERGIYSDIEHNSIVVFLRKKKTKMVYARLMLRMCVYDPATNKVSIGYDKYWYRGNDSHERFTVNQQKKFEFGEPLTAYIATREVLSILKVAGFNLDYKECITPYVHDGYSDVEQRKETVINYSSEYKECPICGEIVPVDRYGHPRCNKCSKRYTCMHCGGRFPRSEFHVDSELCNECYREEPEPESEDDEEPEDEEPAPRYRPQPHYRQPPSPH